MTKALTRNQSRGISRRRLRIMALNPCVTYCDNRGINPFAYLFQRCIDRSTQTEDERRLAHKLKMESEQRSAKARQQRKRNKV